MASCFCYLDTLLRVKAAGRSKHDYVNVRPFGQHHIKRWVPICTGGSRRSHHGVVITVTDGHKLSILRVLGERLEMLTGDATTAYHRKTNPAIPNDVRNGLTHLDSPLSDSSARIFEAFNIPMTASAHSAGAALPVSILKVGVSGTS